MFEQSALTTQLVSLLRSVNGDIEYRSIEKATGHEIDRLRGPLGTARRILEKEKIAFAVERGVGLRRLSDAAKVQSTEKHKRAMRNSAKRGIRRLDSIDKPTLLSNTDGLTATINRTLFEAVKQHTSLRAPTNARAVSAPAPDHQELLEAVRK